MSNFSKRLAGFVGGSDRPAPPAPADPLPRDERGHLSAKQAARLDDALREIEARILGERAARLRQALSALEAADPASDSLPLVRAEVGVRDLAEVSPEHPMLDQAREAIAAFSERFAAALPPLRTVGQVADACPTCLVPLKDRPQRKARCPHCGAFIFCRTRPIDEARVLLKESDLPALEEDWRTDYRMKQRQPRIVDPVWAARMLEASTAGPDQDPRVESAAQQLAAAVMTAPPGTAPRDARDNLLAQFSDLGFRARVDQRLWQILVQTMSLDSHGPRGADGLPR